MCESDVKFKKAKLLEDGWQWCMYDDGSGHLESADGTSYFSYDIETQEYIDKNQKWQFMCDYPAHTLFDKFKCYMENDIVQQCVAKYNSTILSIKSLEESLEISEHDRCFKNDEFAKWSAYDKTEELKKALSELYEQRECDNSFDLNTVGRLAEFYSANAICNMMTDANKEIFVDGIECERDFGNDIPNGMYEVYKEIIAEQSQIECQGIQM